MTIIGNPIYDRAQDASFFSEFFADFIGNGVYPNPSVGMQVLADTGMNLKIQTGRCFINGHRGKVEEEGETITIENSDTNFNRIDRVVARLNVETRKITIEVLKGIPATNPIAVDLTRNSNIYELGLADVTINKNSSVVTQANIVDTRLNNSLCGIVKGVIEQVDTTTLFNQYQTWFQEKMLEADNNYNTWFEEFTEPAETEFTTWFNNMKDQLTEDAAGHLQQEINTLKTSKVDIQEINNLNETISSKCDGEILYESETGSTGTISLNSIVTNFNINNYSKIKIYGEYGNKKTVNEIHNPKINDATTLMIVQNQIASANRIYLRFSDCVLQQNSIIQYQYFIMNTERYVDNTGTVLIKKIVGYKKEG